MVASAKHLLGGTALNLICAVGAGNVVASNAQLLHDVSTADFSINPAMLILPTAVILAG